MNNVIEKKFDTVTFFRDIKDKLSAKMKGMTLTEKKEFMKKLKNGDIKLA
ncbi:MAG: hypothetical protein NW207_12670 [Cytophagales bacterium]|nr:hypothetical protein [Cytophagales bacterium]